MSKKVVYFYHKESNQIVQCSIIVKKRVTSKVQLLDGQKQGKKLKVHKVLLADTPEAAIEKYRVFEEEQQKKEKRKMAAYELQFDSYTMAYFREGKEEVLLQIMESKARTFIVYDQFGNKRVKRKTSFIRLSDERLFVLPDMNNIREGNIVRLIFQNKPVEGTVVKVFSERVHVKIDGIEKIFEVPKKLCKKLFRCKEDWFLEDMKYELDFFRTSYRADRVRDWLLNQGVPCVVKFNKMEGYILCTNEKYYPQATMLLSESTSVRNLFTGQVVQEAKWA